MALLAVLILTIGLSVAAIKLGAHIALALQSITPTIPFRLLRRFAEPIMVFVSFGCWFGAVLMVIWPPDRPGGPNGLKSWAQEHWRGDALFALVFAPIGCLLRFYAALHFNGTFISFPLGTFAANVFGTLVLGLTWDLQHVRLPNSNLIGGGLVGCQILQGIEDGFCGCLTTVSTVALELNSLRRRHAYIYGASTVFAGLSSMIVIMGSLRWTLGFDSKVC